MTTCLTQNKVVELEAALATALEGEKRAKQEDRKLRGRLLSLAAEVA